MKSKKKKKERKKEKKKKLTRKKFGPAHSHETLRGRGRSCWIKADEKFANRAKRKRKRRKRKEKCAYMCEPTWHHHGRLKQFWLQQCTLSESAVLTWTWACCASNCTLLAALPCFFRSRFVRAATLLSISQARKWSPSLWSFKNRSRPWFLRAQAKNQHFLECLSTSRLLEESSLRRVTVADGCLCLNCIAARNQTFSSYLSLKLSVLPLHADLPWKFLVVSNHALLKSFLQHKKQSLPNVRLHVGRIVDRSMDPEVLTANLNGQVPHDEGCRSLRTSTVFGRLPTAGTSNWRDSRHCLLSELETKAVSNFCIDSFHITWWLWKPVQLDGHLDWLHFDTYWSLNNCTCSCMKHWHDSFRSRGIKMESIKVAIQLHWFLWPPRYVKLVYSESGRENCSSGRNDEPDLRVLGAKLRLHQVFWSQNLAFKSQNATMRPDFSSPADPRGRVEPHCFCPLCHSLSLVDLTRFLALP